MTIYKILKRNLGKIIALSISVLLVNALKLMIPYMLEKTVNDFGNLYRYLIELCILLITLYAIQLTYEVIKKKYAIEFQTQEAIKMVQLMQGMDYEVIKKMEPTYIVNRIMESVGNIFEFVVNSISQLSGGIISIIVVIFLLARYNLWISICYIIYALISFWGYKFINKRLLIRSIKLQDIVANCYKNILCFLTNVDFLKLLYDFKVVKNYVKKYFKKSNKENAEVGYYAACVSLLLELFLDIMQNTIYILLFYLAYCGKINFAQVASIVALNGIFKNSMQILNSTNIGLRDVKASIHFINEVLLKYQEKCDGKENINSVDSISAEFKNIKYDNNILVENGSFNAKRGDVIGIVGESGIGKSTLLKIILGIKNDSDSNVFFNGINSEIIDNNVIRKRIGYVSQNKAIFPISIKENFLIFDLEKIKQKKYDELLEIEGFKKFKNIEETEAVLEGANNLSGGDQQKIAIGRYLLEEPNVLILDEFSNSLDKKTEEYLMDLITQKYKDKIIILVTHDKHILKWCTRIYELKNKTLKNITY